MPSFHELTIAQLKQAVLIREQIETLQGKLASLLGGTAPSAKTSPATVEGKRTRSAATRKKMAVAQQARRAKTKEKPAPAKSAPGKAAPEKKGGLTEEGRAKLAAAMKARWTARKKGAPAPNASAS